jgi:hypothetical protein
LDHDKDREKGRSEPGQHTLDHLRSVPQHCYVVEDGKKQIIAVMALHPRSEILQIEGFHVKEIERNREGFGFA